MENPGSTDEADSRAEAHRSPRGDEHSAALDRALREYIEAKERGDSDRAAWLARYPEFRHGLTEYFADEDFFDEFVPPATRRSGEEAPSRPPLPERLGDYDVLDEIDRGGMGIVVRARHRTLRRLVAVKLLVGGTLSDSDDRRRFRREARTVARLDHPGIVPILEVGEHAGVDWFAMKLIDGRRLDAAHDRWRDPRSAAVLVARVASAVDHAHRHGVLHRDLKPENILIDAVGDPHVTDFGLAKPLSSEHTEELTHAGAVVGTTKYLAPEIVASGSARATVQSDVYALGMILYELLVGRVAFDGATPLEIMRRIVEREPEPPRRRRASVPADLETIALKCLDKSPEKRYATAAALADELDRFVRGEPISARRQSAVATTWRWVRRRPTTATAIVLAALLIVGGIAGAFFYYERELEFAAEIRWRDQRNQRYVYAQRLGLAYESLIDGRPDDARSHLASQEPGPQQRDLRDFGWYHLLDLLDRDDADRGVRGLPDTRSQRDFEPLAIVPSEQRVVLRRGTALELWDIGSPAAHREAVFDSKTRSPIEVAPESRRIAVVDDEERIAVVDVTRGSIVTRVIPLPADGPSPVSAFALSGDGSRIAVGHANGCVTIWDVASGVRVDEAPPVDGEQATRIAWSPDGARLALLDGKARRLTIWDLVGRAVVARASTRWRAILRFSPDGSHVVCANNVATFWPGGAEVFDAASGELVYEIPNERLGIGALAFSADGRELAIGGHDGGISVWDTEGWVRRVRVDGSPAPVLGLAATADGFASASSDGRVRFWNRLRIENPRYAEVHANEVWYLGLSANGRQLVSADLGLVAKVSNVTADGGLCEIAARDFAGSVRTGSVSPDGRWIAAASAGEIRLLRGATGDSGAPGAYFEPVWRSRGDSFLDLEFSPDSRRVAVVGDDELTVLEIGESNAGIAVETAHRFDLRAIGVVPTRHIRFAPDGKLLVVRSRGGVEFFDLERSTHVRLGKLDGDPLNRMSFSPDSKLFVSSHVAGTIHVWEVRDGADGIELERRSTLEHGTRPIWALEFAPDGALVSGSDDGTIRFWDLVEDESGWTGLERCVLAGHQGVVNCLRFSADGETLFSGGGRNTSFGEVLVWRAPRR